MKTLRNSILFTLLAGFIVACPKHSSKSPSNTLRTDLGGNAGALDPQGAFDPYTFRVLSDLDEGIIAMDQSNNPIAGMAESWSVSDDGLTYDFYLRHDLKFSDGAPIDAESFVYSWRRMVSPETGGYGGSTFSNIVNASDIIKDALPEDKLGVEAVDKYTFRVNLAKPDPAFIEKCTAVFTSPVPQHTIEKYAESWVAPEHLVTSGAYKLVSKIASGEITLAKNPNYYDVKNVALESIVFVPYQDRNSALSAYKTGALDILNGVPIDQYTKLKQDYANELKTVSYEGITFYSLNVFSDKLQNLNVREALSLAVDRETLANTILANGQKPLYSYTTSTVEHGRYKSLQYEWTEWSQERRNERAQELFKEAEINPKQFTIDLTYDNNDLSKKTAVAVASMWQKTLGIKTNLQAVEWATYLDKRKNSDFEVLRNSWGAAFNHITTYTPEYACASNVNVSRLCTINYDELIKDANQDLDYERQTKFYERALMLAMEQYAVIPLYQNSYTMMISPDIKGLNVESNLLHDIRSKWISKK